MRLTRRRLAQLAAFGAHTAFLGKSQVSGPQHDSQAANQDGKFEDCARFANWPGDRIAAIVENVRTLEKVADIRTVTGLLSS